MLGALPTPPFTSWFMRTEMTRRCVERCLTRKIVERRTPLGRMGEPEDVARVALFLPPRTPTS